MRKLQIENCKFQILGSPQCKDISAAHKLAIFIFKFQFCNVRPNQNEILVVITN